MASYLGLKQVIQDILREDKTDVNIPVGSYGTALQAALAQGHKEVVQLLLDEGADINLRGGNDITALQAALAGGHREIVQILVKKQFEQAEKKWGNLSNEEVKT